MAGKAKSCYLTVSRRDNHKGMFTRMFMNAKDLNSFISTDEFKEKYPEAEFYLTKEVY